MYILYFIHFELRVFNLRKYLSEYSGLLGCHTVFQRHNPEHQKFQLRPCDKLISRKFSSSKPNRHGNIPLFNGNQWMVILQLMRRVEVSLSVGSFSSSSRYNFSTSSVRPFVNYCFWVCVKCSCESVRPFPLFLKKSKFLTVKPVSIAIKFLWSLVQTGLKVPVRGAGSGLNCSELLRLELLRKKVINFSSN